MAAYVVLIRDKITDPVEYERYGELAKAARGGHPSKPLAFYGEQEVLEGPQNEGVVILEFPTMEAAKAWYHDPAYQEAVTHRLKGAQCQLVIVQGVST